MQNQMAKDQNIFDEKEIRIKELEKKLKETEEKLNQLQNENELRKDLGTKVINNTVEINRLLKHKSHFIDNLSHDLATPITPLISLLPIIKEELSNEESKVLLDTCIRNVEYIKRVINNSRELADIESTDFIFRRENLADIVDQLIKKYDIVFKGYNVKTQNSIDRNIIIKTEKNRLLQLFDHLTHSNYFTKRLKDPTNQICSSLVAWIYYILFGMRFNYKVWYSCDPDDVDDEVSINNKNGYFCTKES